MSSMLMYQQLYCYWWKWKANKTKTEIEGEGDEQDTSYDCVTRKKEPPIRNIRPSSATFSQVKSQLLSFALFFRLFPRIHKKSTDEQTRGDYEKLKMFCHRKKWREEENVARVREKKNVEKVESIRDSIIVISRVCRTLCLGGDNMRFRWVWKIISSSALLRLIDYFHFLFRVFSSSKAPEMPEIASCV